MSLNGWPLLDTQQIILVFSAMFAASLVQGAIGFAVALILIPMLLLADFTLPESIVLVLVTSNFLNFFGWWKLRKEVTWQDIKTPTMLRMGGILAGFACLPIVNLLETHILKQIFGLLLIVVILLPLFVRIKPQEKLQPGWDWLAFGSSGFLQGTIGVGGPPIVLWLMAHDWSHQKNRAFLFVTFLVASVPHLILLCLVYREQVLWPTFVGLSGIPVIVLGSLVGLWIGNRLNARLVRASTYALLILLALNLVLDPF